MRYINSTLPTVPQTLQIALKNVRDQSHPELTLEPACPASYTMQPWRMHTAHSGCNCINCNQTRRTVLRFRITYSSRYNPYAQSVRTVSYFSANPNMSPNMEPNSFGNQQNIQAGHYQYEQELQDGNNPEMDANEGLQVVPSANEQYQQQENNPNPIYQLGNNLIDFHLYGNARYRLVRYQNNMHRFNVVYQYSDGYMRVVSYIAYGNLSNPASLVYYRLANERIFYNPQAQ